SSVRLLMLTSVPLEAEVVADAGFSARLTKPARRSQLYDALLRATAPPGQVPLPPAASVPPPVVPTKGRLLVVEDNAINQAVAKGLAAKLGYATDLAGNGIEALEALRRRHYDAVLMDCQMPEMDGFEATAEIRRQEAAAGRVPIIAMTAGALAEDRERCLAAGMDDYVAKPVKGRDLDAVLTRWVAAERRSPGPEVVDRAPAGPRS
ncbi:MAG TPA: response regulator, partial [Actinomycetes bacterium]|nr:response regulator [Actinomycetes bacterium]